MQNRGARLALFALLASVGAAAAVLSWDTDRKLRALDEAQRDIAQRLDVMSAALADIGLAQHGYVALGETGIPPETIVASLVQQFETDAAALGLQGRSAEAAATVGAVADAMGKVIGTDTRVRDYARSGQTLLASSLLSGAAREHLSAAGRQLRELRAAETAAATLERAALRQEEWTALGAAAGIWAAGLLLLAWTGGRTRATATSPGPRSAQDPIPAAPPAETPATKPVPTTDTVDLAAAATLCTDLSRVTTTAALPDLLTRAATILDARGLIVWIGAGDQLFAATTHGYDTRMVTKLAPIDRTAVNATATVWRTGRLGIVRGEGASTGAIVAPLFDTTRCIGVLAAEVRHGREGDAATRAVTAMIAAQLATVLPAWPAGGTTQAVGGRG